MQHVPGPHKELEVLKPVVEFDKNGNQNRVAIDM